MRCCANCMHLDSSTFICSRYNFDFKVDMAKKLAEFSLHFLEDWGTGCSGFRGSESKNCHIMPCKSICSRCLIPCGFAKAEGFAK